MNETCSDSRPDSDSVTVSISAASALQDAIDHHASNNALAPANNNTVAESSSSAVSISASHTAHSNTAATTTTEPRQLLDDPTNQSAPKPPAILLPPVEIEPRANSSNKENIDPLSGSTHTADSAKPGAAKLKTAATSSISKGTKPATSSLTKRPLTASTGRVAGATTVAGTSSIGTRSAASSLTKTPLASSSTTRARPPIPAALRGSTSSSSLSAASRPSASTTTTGTASTTRTTAALSAARSLAPPAAATTQSIRKSSSTSALSSSSTSSAAPVRNSTLSGRRVASTSSVGTASSSRASPATTPVVTRPSSRSSVASSVGAIAKRPATANPSLPSSLSAATTVRSSLTQDTCGTATRRTLISSTNIASRTAARTTTTQAAALAVSSRKTPATSTTAPAARTAAATSTTASAARTTSATPVRPVTDAAKVKMLSTQLNGLQEKHDQTLKLLQEQEERMRRELEELTLVPEPQRKPISSDVQEVLKEMEELRRQFNESTDQHEKTLADLTAQRTLEVSELKVAHEALLAAMVKERDTVAESLKALLASGELTERERDSKIRELEEQMEASIKAHSEAVTKHSEELENIRTETETAWATKHESKVQELTAAHEEQIKAMENNAVASGSSKDTEIQESKASFAQQIKDLEDEQETRILELFSKHESEVQNWKDKLTNETDAHEELLALLRQEHSEAMGALKAELETVRTAKYEAESELDRANSETKEEMDRIRAEMEGIRQLLASKDAQVAELNKRVEELTDDLENASMSTMLKNTKKYKLKNVQIYGSSVSGNLKIKRAQQTISDHLVQLEIEYEFVDVSVSEEAKRHMRRKNGGETQLPQIFTGGEYRGVFDDFEYAIETHQLPQFLGFDRVRGFVPRHKVEYAPATLAQDGEDAEQGPGLPAVVVNGLGNRIAATSTSPLTANSKNNGSGADIGTSMFLLSPGSHKFQSDSPPRSNLRPGFVQNASQMWDGVLKSDITRTKHDLGFSSTLLLDDDELDELFEQGAVSEADLEAMLQSV